MNDHTRGPWAIGRSIGTGEPCIVGDGDSVVCFLPDPLIGCTYKPADAALIADAPNLLEALAGMLSIHTSVTMGQEQEFKDRWVPVARALIKKHCS